MSGLDGGGNSFMMGTIVQLLSSELRLSNVPGSALTLVRGASPDTSPVGLFCGGKQQFKIDRSER